MINFATSFVCFWHQNNVITFSIKMVFNAIAIKSWLEYRHKSSQIPHNACRVTSLNKQEAVAFTTKVTGVSCCCYVQAMHVIPW